jgi:hypothetical protein
MICSLRMAKEVRDALSHYESLYEELLKEQQHAGVASVVPDRLASGVLIT